MPTMDNTVSSRSKSQPNLDAANAATHIASVTPSQPEFEPEPQTEAEASPSTALSPTLPRKRGHGHVTPYACTACRKKHTKCDGQQPCGPCLSQEKPDCQYDIPARQSKDELRTTVEHLRQQRRLTDEVLAAVTAPNTSDGALALLRRGQSTSSISEWAREARSSMTGSSPDQPFGSQVSHASSMSLNTNPTDISAEDRTSMVHGHLPEQLFDSSGSYSTESLLGSLYPEYDSGMPSNFFGLEQVLWPISTPTSQPLSRNWTKITGDINLIHHLLALYFCWEFPIFGPFHKECFLRDFHNGERRYCSSLLINAILSLSCRFSALPFTRVDPTDPASAGDHFFEEARLLLDKEATQPSLTTVQALGVMSAREVSCGRDQEGRYYAAQSLRLAIEMGLNRVVGGEVEKDLSCVQLWTFWGAFSLDSVLSLTADSLPQHSYLSPRPPKPPLNKEVEESFWIPYTEYVPMQDFIRQPSSEGGVFICFCELGELIHDSLYFLHSPVTALTGNMLLSIYTRYLNWYSSIPEGLRLGRNSTPAILFAHMCYYFAILRLFRPFLTLQIVGSAISPAATSHEAADAIQALLMSYSYLYTLVKTPSLVPYLTLGSAISHLNARVATTLGD